MGIVFLAGLLFGALAIFCSRKKNKNPDKKIKWPVVLFAGIVGMILGAAISIDVGKRIANKYLANQATVTVLENIGLLPFSGSFGAYIVTGENQYGEKVAWYLQEKEFFEKPYSIIDRNKVVFSNASAPSEQLVRVNVGIFWRWFAIIPNEYRFVIPAGGLQEGKIVKTYKYISVPE